jgi:hypothetical protein
VVALAAAFAGSLGGLAAAPGTPGAPGLPEGGAPVAELGGQHAILAPGERCATPRPEQA